MHMKKIDHIGIIKLYIIIQGLRFLAEHLSVHRQNGFVRGEPRGRNQPVVLRGEVHDENGWALGGVAGHTGRFGTVPAVGRFARTTLTTLRGSPLLAEPSTVVRFLRRSSVAGSSRALGWDTMLLTSSCGRKLSAEAVGHTGFTGTSLWIDPTQALYVALLTNRVHPTRDNEAILDLRPAVHDAVVEALSS